MTVSLNKSAFVVKAGQTVALSQMVTVTSGSNPAYLVLTGLDRNEYPAGSTGATGTLSGNGATAGFTSQGGDFRGVGIVFTYNAATGQYVNSTYGNLSSLDYTVSGSLDDLTNFGLFATSSLSLADEYASSPSAMMYLADNGYASYLGSASFATQPGFSGTAPSQATPNSIAATAQSFVGQAWNADGCWVLASTIATEAGAALPMYSTQVGVAAQGSGEWFVAYDGPVSASANWESLVHAGEVVSFVTGAGGGHIVTVVSGSGSTAEIVDNVQYVSNGKTVNLANDGSATDVSIAAPHLFTGETSGVSASSVVIYELDTPVVTASVASDSLACKATQSLAALFSAADPEGKAVTEVQVYDSNAADEVSIGGVLADPTSAATAVTAGSLGAVTLDAAGTAGTDTLEVRAFNGSYWGDWTSLGVTVSGTAATQAPPVVAHQTASQSWTAGQAVSLNLSGVFTDPQGEALTLSVTQSSGAALPSGLSFNAATDTLSGTAPITAETLGLKVTATDTGGLSASETFQAVITAAGPQLALQTGTQTWAPGSSVNFTLPSGTFTDAVTQHMFYTAYQTSGASLTSWLRFNTSTDTFSGTVPVKASGTVGLEVIAADSSGRFATDSFSVVLSGSTSSTTTHV